MRIENLDYQKFGILGVEALPQIFLGIVLIND
jgi:hypothetical protein